MTIGINTVITVTVDITACINTVDNIVRKMATPGRKLHCHGDDPSVNNYHYHGDIHIQEFKKVTWRAD